MAYVNVGVDIKGRNSDALRSIAAVKLALHGLRREQRNTAISMRHQELHAARLNKTLQLQSRTLRSLTLDYVAVRRTLLTLGIRAAVTGFVALTASMNSAATSAAALGASLASLGGAAGIGGAASIASLIQGIGTLSLALDGLGKAYTSFGKEHTDALDKLGKRQREFYNDTKELTQAFRTAKVLAQDGLFPGLLRAFNKIKPLARHVAQNIHDTAQTLGYLAEQAADAAVAMGPRLNRIASRNVVTMRRMGLAAIAGGKGLAIFVDEAEGLIGTLTNDFRKFFVNTEKDLRKWARGGMMDQFFSDLKKSWENGTAIIGNIFEGIFGTWEAIQPVVHQVEDSIERVTDKFSKWANSPTNQLKINQFFEDSLGPMREFLALVGDLGKLWVDFSIQGNENAERFFRGLREDFLPILRDLFSFFNEKLLPSLMDIGEAFSAFLREAMPGIKTLLGLLEPVADYLTFILRLAKDIVGVFNQFGSLSGAIGTFLVTTAIISSWKKLRTAIHLTWGTMRALSGSPGAVMPNRGDFARLVPGFGLVQGGRRAAQFPRRTATYVRQRYRDAVELGAERTGVTWPPRSARSPLDPRPTYLNPRDRPFQHDMPQFRDPLGTSPRIDTPSAMRQFGGVPVVTLPAGSGDRRGPGAGGSAAQRRVWRRANPVPLGGGGQAMWKAYEAEMSRSTQRGFLAGMRSATAGRKASAGPMAAFGGNMMSMLGWSAVAMAAPLAITGAIGLGKRLTRDDRPKPVRALADLGADMHGIRGGLGHDPRIRNLSADIEQAAKEGNAKKLTELALALGKVADATADVARKNKLKQVVGDVQALAAATTSQIKGRVLEDFEIFAARGDTSIGKIRDGLAVLQNQIGNKIPNDDAPAYKEAMSESFGAAAAQVKAAMDAGLMDIKKGTREYRRLLKEQFSALGFTNKQARNLASGQRLDGGANEGSAGPRGTGAAVGGFFLGSKGQRGRDNIPLNVAGQPVVAGAGEYVAILNAQQQQAFDAMAARFGYNGMEGFFSANNRPHYMAGGGLIPLGRRLQAMGYHVGEHSAFGGVGQHAPNSRHYVDRALDVNADHWPGGEMAALDKLNKLLLSEGWHTLWRTKGHFDHLHVDDLNGIRKAIAALKRVKAGGSGMLGGLVQGVLDRFGGGAQQHLESLASVPGEFGSGSGFVGGAPAANMKLAKAMMLAFGWGEGEWSSLRALGMGESGWDSTATNPSSGAFGIGQFLGATKDAYAKYGAASSDPERQINAMLRYIKDRYGSPSAAYSAWLARSPHWYSLGGMIPAFAGFMSSVPGLQDGYPDVDPNDARPNNQSEKEKRKREKEKKKKKDKDKFIAKGRPKVGSGYSREDFAPRSKKPKKPKARKKIRDLIRKRYKFRGTYQTDPLTGEQTNPYLTMQEVFGRKLDRLGIDLDLMMGRHDLTTEEAYVDDVLNPSGVTKDGRFIPGIAHAIAEFREQLGVHEGKGGVLNTMLMQQGHLEGIPYERAISERRSRIAKMKRFFEANVELRKKLAKKMRRMKDGIGWKGAVSHNDDLIRAWQRWKRDSDETPAQRRQADSEIDRLQDENRWLQKKKPRRMSTTSPGYREAFAAYQRAGVENRMLVGDPEATQWQPGQMGGAVGRHVNSLQFWLDTKNFATDALPDLRGRIGQERLTIQGLYNAITEWSGFRELPKEAADTSARDELLKQIGEDALRDRYRSGLTFDALSSFAKLVGQRSIGAFAHGGPVTETGMALVHRGEYIVPNPQGPYRNGMNAPANVNVAPNVTLVLQGEAASLVRLVDSRIEDKSAKVSSRRIGRDRRIISVSPGGR